MLADAPSPRGFGADLAVVGPLFKGFGRIVASPPYLVGYVRWDARSNQAHLLVRQSFSTALQIYSYSSHMAQEPKRAHHFLSHQEDRLWEWIERYVQPRVDRREHGRMLEQSYDPIVPMKVGNRRAPARGGHGTHWREGVARADVSEEGNIVETQNSVAMYPKLDRLSAPNPEKIPEERW